MSFLDLIRIKPILKKILDYIPSKMTYRSFLLSSKQISLFIKKWHFTHKYRSKLTAPIELDTLKIARFDLNHMLLHSHKKVLIVGPAGSGKTTLLKQILMDDRGYRIEHSLGIGCCSEEAHTLYFYLPFYRWVFINTNTDISQIIKKNCPKHLFIDAPHRINWNEISDVMIDSVSTFIATCTTNKMLPHRLNDVFDYIFLFREHMKSIRHAWFNYFGLIRCFPSFYQFDKLWKILSHNHHCIVIRYNRICEDKMVLGFVDTIERNVFWF